MRMIGSIKDEAAAACFRDYLLVQGIENQLEREADGHWNIWVHSDDEIERASQYLADYKANPEDSRFHIARTQLEDIRARQKAKQAEFEKRFHGREDVFPPIAGLYLGPLTIGLMAICTIVFLYQSFGGEAFIRTWLSISNPSDFRALQHFYHNPWDRLSALHEIRRGEIWRLITPILMHGDILHFLFNMIWLKDLGTILEARIGSAYLALMVVLIAAVSNVAQMMVSGPNFLGMSGVVYGLLGYIWIRGKFDPFCGLYLHKTIVTMMLIWFFACLFVIPGIANTVHAAGLVSGMLWGYIDAKR